MDEILGGLPTTSEVVRSLRRGTDVPHNGAMSESLNRPELDAKLEAVEARMDARIARIEAAAEGIRRDVDKIESKVGNLKVTMVTTAIGATIAIVLGIAAFNATLTSNMLSAFQAGLQSVKADPPASTQ